AASSPEREGAPEIGPDRAWSQLRDRRDEVAPEMTGGGAVAHVHQRADDQEPGHQKMPPAGVAEIAEITWQRKRHQRMDGQPGPLLRRWTEGEAEYPARAEHMAADLQRARRVRRVQPLHSHRKERRNPFMAVVAPVEGGVHV